MNTANGDRDSQAALALDLVREQMAMHNAAVESFRNRVSNLLAIAIAIAALLGDKIDVAHTSFNAVGLTIGGILALAGLGVGVWVIWPTHELATHVRVEDVLEMSQQGDELREQLARSLAAGLYAVQLALSRRVRFAIGSLVALAASAGVFGWVIATATTQKP